jgi:hypothetical protein
MARGVLLYVGAHVDVYPLTCAELRRRYRRFVYVDGSPASKYWEPAECRGAKASASESTMMASMRAVGEKYAGMSEFALLPCGGYEATLADDASIVYYFNSEDAARVPRDVLDSVTALYMHGYAPDARLVGMLPNVTRVYSTPLCVGEAYWAVCGRQGRQGRHGLIDESYWDSGDEEFVVHPTGASRLVSDAPHRVCARRRPATRP